MATHTLRPVSRNFRGAPLRSENIRDLHLVGHGANRFQQSAGEDPGYSPRAANSGTPEQRRGTSRTREFAQAGFTLAEMLVAVALIGGIMALSTSLYATIAGKSREGGALASRLDMTSRGLAALRHDLQRLQRIIVRDRDKTNFVFTGKRNEISFVVHDPDYPTEAGSYVVTYQVRGRRTDAQLVRLSAPYDVAADKNNRSTRTKTREEEVVVLEGPYTFAFQYLERVETKSTWVDTWAQPSRLPILIRFSATSSNAATPNLPVTIVEPRVNGEFTCVMPGTGLCSPQTGGIALERAGASSGPPPGVETKQ